MTMTPMSIHEPSNTTQALPLRCRATLASIRSRPLCYSRHLPPVPEITSIKSGLRTPQNLSNNAIPKLVCLPFPSHVHTFISLFTIQYLCKKLINTGCIRSGLRTRNPGTPPELGARPLGEVVVTIPADLSASWFASAPAELVQSQPQRPSAD